MMFRVSKGRGLLHNGSSYGSGELVELAQEEADSLPGVIEPATASETDLLAPMPAVISDAGTVEPPEEMMVPEAGWTAPPADDIEKTFTPKGKSKHKGKK